MNFKNKRRTDKLLVKHSIVYDIFYFRSLVFVVFILCVWWPFYVFIIKLIEIELIMLNVVLYGILGLVDIGTQYLSLCAIIRLNQAVPTIIISLLYGFCLKRIITMLLPDKPIFQCKNRKFVKWLNLELHFVKSHLFFKCLSVKYCHLFQKSCQMAGSILCSLRFQ